LLCSTHPRPPVICTLSLHDALPIYGAAVAERTTGAARRVLRSGDDGAWEIEISGPGIAPAVCEFLLDSLAAVLGYEREARSAARSEERRVGEECRARWTS